MGDRLPHVDPASQQRRLTYWTNALAQLDKIPVDQLSPEEKVNAAVFRTALEAFVSQIRFKEYEDPFGFWTWMAPRTGFGTVAEYRAYLGRLRDMPRYVDEQIANMKAGQARGFTKARASIEGRHATIAPLASSDPAANPFFGPFANMPSSIPAGERDKLMEEGRAAVTGAAAPAFGKLLTYVRDDYIPHARTNTAAESLPDGKAFYQAKIREYTTTDLTAEQIHQIGLSEVARISAEMEKVKEQSGFKGDMPAFLKFLRTDPQFYAKTPDELLGVSAYVAKRVDGKLKDTIGLLPRYRFTIVPVPAAIAPYYTSGRGGLESCQMNTYDLPSRPLYQIPALTLHECNPGHSFQAAVALEQTGRPAFRKQTYFSGYGEGW
ncbi:MAG: DUF885 domain-containing protein, partial [Phenylobacterium zucineum]